MGRGADIGGEPESVRRAPDPQEGFEALQDAVYVKDCEGRIVWVNESGAALLGLARDEVLGRTDAELLPANTAEVRELDGRILESGTAEAAEEALVIQGALKTFLSTKAPIFDQSGRPLGLIGISTDISQRKATEEELRRREAALAEAQAVAQVGSWEWDLRDGAESSWSAELCRIFGVDPDSFKPNPGSFLEFVHPGDRARVSGEAERALETGSDYEVVYRIVRPDGDIRTVMARARVFTDLDGEPLRMVGAGLDLTDRLEQHERLESRTALLNLSQELTSAGCFEWEVGATEVDWSDGMFRIFGLEPGSEAPTLDRYLEFVHPDERDDRRAEIGRVVENGQPYDAEHRIIRTDGQVRWVESRIRLIGRHPEQRARLIGACQDVTDRRLKIDGMASEVESARVRALHDPLTGLANRTLAFDRLDHAFDLAQRTRRDLAVLFLDLDGFKRMNDRFGHAAGDSLLTSAAKRMSECVRGSDTVSRIGGDEFLIICEGPDGTQQARTLASRLHEAFSSPMRIADGDLQVSVSIGVSVLDGRPVDSPRQLVEEADQAMYRAKAEGPGGVFVHSPGS